MTGLHALALWLALSASEPCPDGGVVVEEAVPGFAAAKVGLQPGDVLCRWERAATPPANPEAAGGAITSPFQVDEMEIEQAPRGDLTLLGHRGSTSLTARVPRGAWRLRVRPVVEAEGSETSATWLLYRAGIDAIEKQLWNAADSALEAARRRAEAADDRPVLAMVLAAIGRGFYDRGEWDRAQAAYREALSSHRAAAPASLGEAAMLRAIGLVAWERGELDSAEQYLREALQIRERLAPESLEVALSLQGLGSLASDRGALEEAERLHRRALTIREAAVPEGLEVADSLNNLGALYGMRRDLDTAEVYVARALAITERLAPQSEQMALMLNNLALVGEGRGDLAAAERHLRRALVVQEGLSSPGSLKAAFLLSNLGSIAAQRGDLIGAEDYLRRALAIQEEQARDSLTPVTSLQNLASLALERGDLAAAEEYHARALALTERLAPGSAPAAVSLTDLGIVAERRGDLRAAETYHRRALAVSESIAPQSDQVARSLYQLAEVARKRGEPAAARGRLQEVLKIMDGFAPGGSIAADAEQLLGEIALAAGELAEAERRFQRAADLWQGLGLSGAGTARAYERLGAVKRRRGRPAEAVDLYRKALDALDERRRLFGGTDEARGGFSARHASCYHDAVALLVELGRPEEAFHVLERYRARGWLARLAERDLVFSADVPAELDREQRMANAAYDRVWAELAKAKEPDIPSQREELARVGRRRSEIRDKIRAASQRLAALQDPQPLDLAAVHDVLDPGTLLLSYAVGEDRSYVFAVGPGADDVGAFRLDIRASALRRDVGRFRHLLQEQAALKRRQLDRLGWSLGTRLLGPVAGRLHRAERVVLVLDGPLHLLPFAALADPGAEGRHLVERLPLHVAASATVFGELKKRRRSAAAIRVVAFGDPDYSAVPSPDKAGMPPQLRPALVRGLDLRPLPASRSEVEDLRALFPEVSNVFLGRDATEERAKTAGRAATILHFACHGLADESSPLDSSLALSLPADWQPGQPNGLLQAWEIFEQVRLDADLVTLSACGTALGKEMSGEGILGLTRAFQYAGARSVLASLWSVRDESTAELMRRFYRHLRDGKTKDAALRAAQVEMIRGRPSSHPGRWAAFELVGDWR